MPRRPDPRHLDRRCLALCLLALFTTALTWPTRDVKELAVMLAPLTAMLGRVVGFYFPRRDARKG